MPVATIKRRLKDALDADLITHMGSGREGDAYRWHPVDAEVER